MAARDPRYTLRREWAGYSHRVWVIRFCGEWIGRAVNREHGRDLRRALIADKAHLYGHGEACAAVAARWAERVMQ